MPTNKLIKFFNYSHLPAPLQEVSKSFHDLAVHLDSLLEESAEKTVSLRKLLEAKDAGVRSYLEQSE